jgi:eukaryotic-like serine/threonine-protein kinase
MTLKPGDTVHEIYRILAKLSQGGFGVVYLAYDTSEERVVAIKEALENEDAARKLRDEVRALARVYHTNMVRIYRIALD